VRQLAVVLISFLVLMMGACSSGSSGTMNGKSSITGKFNHIVILDQENRTPDNLFGSNPTFEPGVEIATSGINSTGATVPFTPVALASCYDLSHSHQSFERAYNKGAMNGSDKVTVLPEPGCVPGPNPQFRYVDNSSGTVQPYFDLATHYGFANRMFQTNQGPSFPSHQFLLSGTSAPTTGSDLFAAEDPTTPFSGCASGPSISVALINPEGVETRAFPCFDHPTMVDLLESGGLTWRYYAASAVPLWNAPNSISALCNVQMVNGALACTGSEWANVVLNPATVLTDMQNCNLANVSWVTPTGQNSDHAADNTGGGPSWVASIVNAIGTSTCGYWQNTAILITWDDWGGWYDHVPPPQLGQPNGWGTSYVYGFRVPLLVVSAYTPAGYVSNANHDFGSMLRFVETTFGLGLIGPGIWADSYADDLMEFFPLTSPNAFNAISSQLDAAHFINDKEPPTDPDND
jgi:phospholipase C